MGGTPSQDHQPAGAVGGAGRVVEGRGRATGVEARLDEQLTGLHLAVPAVPEQGQGAVLREQVVEEGRHARDGILEPRRRVVASSARHSTRSRSTIAW